MEVQSTQNNYKGKIPRQIEVKKGKLVITDQNEDENEAHYREYHLTPSQRVELASLLLKASPAKAIEESRTLRDILGMLE